MLFGRGTSEDKADKVTAEAIQFREKGDYVRAAKKMFRAQELDPNNPIRYMNIGSLSFEIGNVLYDAGDRDGARENLSRAASVLKKAIDLFSSEHNNLRTHCFYLLGQLNYHAFDRLEAEEWYRKAVAADANHQSAASYLAHLEATRPLILDSSIPIAERASMLPAGECLIFAVPPDWILGYDFVQDDENRIEWTPKGQSVVDWIDLLTVDMRVHPDAAPMQYAKELHDSFSKNFQTVEVVDPVSHTLNGYDEVTIGFAYSDPKPHHAEQSKHIETKTHQFVLYKLIRGRDFFFLVYREWRGDQIDGEHPLCSENTRANWQALLDSVEICDTRVPGYERCRYMIDDSAAAKLGPGARVCVLPPIGARLMK